MAQDADSYFVRLDPQHVRPTVHTGGAWTPHEQHISPTNGLVVHAIDRFVAERGPDDLELARLSIDILGVLGDDDMQVLVDVVRPGRTIELLEVTVASAGRVAVRARAWRLATQDTAAVAGGAGAPLPPPHDLPARDVTALWPGGYIRSLDARPVGVAAPGRATVWLRSGTSLVAGEDASPLARFVALVDTANGIAARESPQEWLFPNVDLTIHLFRPPGGDWVGLDTTVVFGPHGHGLTSTVLHDLDGPVGRAEQVLTVRPRR